MMRLRRASAISVLSLLAWAATASAECAWVFWLEAGDARTHESSSRSACSMRLRAIEGWDSQRARRHERSRSWMRRGLRSSSRPRVRPRVTAHDLRMIPDGVFLRLGRGLVDEPPCARSVVTSPVVLAKLHLEHWRRRDPFGSQTAK
jgi:hypothetical protein